MTKLFIIKYEIFNLLEEDTGYRSYTKSVEANDIYNACAKLQFLLGDRLMVNILNITNHLGDTNEMVDVIPQ